MKQNLLLSFMLSMLFISSQTFAQPVIEGQREAGGNREDQLTAGMYRTKDGGFVAGGYSLSGATKNKTEASRGHSDYWIVKYDSLGILQWDKTFGGRDEDGLYGLQQTKDGGYILGGYSRSHISGDKTEDVKGGVSDYWVIKLDSAGNKLWDKDYGGDDQDNLASLDQTTDGGYILAGVSASGISGDKSAPAIGAFDYWMVKIDSVGHKQWDKTFGGTDYDNLYTVNQTPDGGYILGGQSVSGISGDKTEATRGGNDYWIIKTDSLGNKQWDKTIGGSSTESFGSLDFTPDSGYIIGGTSYSNISGEKTQNSKGGGDFWIVKLNSGGVVEWDKTIGGSNYDGLYTVKSLHDGGSLLLGQSISGVSGNKTEANRGDYDGWVVKLNKSGRIDWDKTIGGSGSELSYQNGILEIKKNQYLIGLTSFSAVSGDKKIASRGGDDYWFVFVQDKKEQMLTSGITHTSELLKATYKNPVIFSVYPNPAKDVLHVRVNGKTTLALTNQSGKTLFTKTIAGTGDISVANLPAGIYYVKDHSAGITQKIIISR